MRLRVMSDIRLETCPAWRLPPQDGSAFDAVLLAGNVVPGMERAVDWALGTFPCRPVIFVPGAREISVGDALTEIEKGRKLAAGTDVHVLCNDTVVLRDARGTEVTFVGTPLWTGFRLFGEHNAKRSARSAEARLPEYRSVRMDFYRRLARATDVVGWHDRGRAFVRAELRKPRTGPRVLVTHHPPHALLGPTIDPSTGFAPAPPPGDEAWLAAADHNAGLSFFGPRLDLAVHGHLNRSVDVSIDGTRVIANPKGCGPWITGRPENPDFDPFLTVEI